MKHIKVRKIGNSIGGIFPKEWGLHEGDVLNVRREENLFIWTRKILQKSRIVSCLKKASLILKRKKTVSKTEIEELFGKYGWKK